MNQNGLGSLSCIIPVLSLLLWSGVVSGGSPDSSETSHVPSAPRSLVVGDSECAPEKPDVSISLLQTRHSMESVKLDGQDRKKHGGPEAWNKIPLSDMTWRFVPGAGDAWAEWHINGESNDGVFHGPGTKQEMPGKQVNGKGKQECALRGDTYNSKQLPADCPSSYFPVGQKICVAGTTYEVTKSWDSVGGATVNHAPKPGRGTIPKGTKIAFGSCGFQTTSSSTAPSSDPKYRQGTSEECGRTNNVKKMQSKSEEHRYCRFLNEADGGKPFCENSFRRGTGQKGLTRLCYWDTKANKCDGGERVICLKTD
eukprot:gnl/MRDRNA2_/MRDRNA2_57599_c0_seq1.p1 gnl/MRDRNA2_/MRDRNA2_57599_c0~~gnl/MRDRNA2_/MRDRNA2_57599_c0_seq1.p1  ORF type:complete len:311 (+),score=47.81 gnl/MRDRNA2_/MRDRNA2_57599_c0_seq1:92-1024(+)